MGRAIRSRWFVSISAPVVLALIVAVVVANRPASVTGEETVHTQERRQFIVMDEATILDKLRGGWAGQGASTLTEVLNLPPAP